MAKGRCSCPDNCTVKTYYDEDAIVCLACPDGTFTDGVGAVSCTDVVETPAESCARTAACTAASSCSSCDVLTAARSKDWGKAASAKCMPFQHGRVLSTGIVTCQHGIISC